MIGSPVFTLPPGRWLTNTQLALHFDTSSGMISRLTREQLLPFLALPDGTKRYEVAQCIAAVEKYNIGRAKKLLTRFFKSR